MNIVTDTLAVGDGPFDMAYNPSNNNMYVTNSGDNSVSLITPSNVIEKTQVIGRINPEGLAYNPSNNNMYIANAGDDTVSILPTTS